MKNIIISCLTIWLLLPINTQAQNIRSAGASLITDFPVMVNPTDTLFQKFFSSTYDKSLVMFCTAMPQAKFYTNEELIILRLNLDKAWHPDKYFTTQNDYDVFIGTWSNQLMAEHKKLTEIIVHEDSLRKSKQ